MTSTESDVCYFEVDAVFIREPVALLEESTWTAGLRSDGWLLIANSEVC